MTMCGTFEECIRLAVQQTPTRCILFWYFRFSFFGASSGGE